MTKSAPRISLRVVCHVKVAMIIIYQTDRDIHTVILMYILCVGNVSTKSYCKSATTVFYIYNILKLAKSACRF